MRRQAAMLIPWTSSLNACYCHAYARQTRLTNSGSSVICLPNTICQWASRWAWPTRQSLCACSSLATASSKAMRHTSRTIWFLYSGQQAISAKHKLHNRGACHNGLRAEFSTGSLAHALALVQPCFFLGLLLQRCHWGIYRTSTAQLSWGAPSDKHDQLTDTGRSQGSCCLGSISWH